MMPETVVSLVLYNIRTTQHTPFLFQPSYMTIRQCLRSSPCQQSGKMPEGFLVVNTGVHTLDQIPLQASPGADWFLYHLATSTQAFNR